MADARFEDGEDAPLKLLAQDAADVPVISALVQDAVLQAPDMTWQRGKRRFACLINRFRWEDRVAAEAAGRPYERARALLVIDGVTAVRSFGFDRTDKDLVLSILSLDWTAGEDGTGKLSLVLAGDGAVEIEVEALDIALQDVTRPYIAPSGKAPDHSA